LAPTFAFIPVPHDSINSYLEAGNFYGMLPYEGRYDAMIPIFFSYNSKAARFNLQSNLSSIDGEVRDARWINYSGGEKVLIIIRNNNQLIFLKPIKE